MIRTDWRRMSGAILVLAGVALLVGCSETQDGSLFGGGSQEGGGGWQIVVKRLYGPEREQLAMKVSEALKAVRGLDPAKVNKESSSDFTVVSYGRYSDLDDSRAKRDMKFIKSLMIPDQGYPFSDAHLEPVPEPDPPIDPSWMIGNTKGYWTLQIAQFQEGKRKLCAVELTKELRKEGVPAYVYHGPVKSMVLIGSYPREAVRTTSRREISQMLKPVNADLKRWKAKYPHLIFNSGYARVKDARGVKARMESQIIKVPRPGASLW